MDWYKDAIIYEVFVRSFKDGNGDGIGDFIGMREKLPYIRDLGITCIWLLPMYPSPLRDDGYDIADYYNIHPDYGTMRDFESFLDEAHSMGIRVIADLVVNHTSNEHPWFKEGVADPDSPYHDYYVWADTPEKFSEARIIFCDTETSNWTYHPQTGKYYWHRFFSHQPDLNFDNPAVEEEMFNIVDFWLSKGLDGFRVDAVPYLYEREGTNCENLPETHEYLRRLRKFIDTRHPGTLLLAEANQWPQDVVEYFGDGDEFHMAFNFPLMPRLFMALRQEDRKPIENIINLLPSIPEACQWAMFLRNHDELTLEMVTDEERDYMYSEYAKDPRMRINLGIRRRLFPLVNKNRRAIELLHSLLLTLPGSPILYYGDEIGMGDNIYLGDRAGVRTPMQWTGDRNADFSTADPSRLFLPLVMDPGYNFQGTNVEEQERSSSSFLNWLKRVLRIRKQHPVFGRGDIQFLHPDNRRVIAYLRRYGNDVVLIVNNLSRYCQYVELDLREYNGWMPVDLFGDGHFPLIGELPYLVTLGPHGLYWFRLVQPEAIESLTPATPMTPVQPRFPE
ncbi:MAG: maltose alpha-D-glucosyltransferase / alpha-amylase [Candidatus Sumerlaeota bacterium]|nr:maltose alpha-D-glucosyltransferase / alpha-amylase [Candidatus Sumerlaeota bacterium]